MYIYVVLLESFNMYNASVFKKILWHKNELKEFEAPSLSHPCF